MNERIIIAVAVASIALVGSAIAVGFSLNGTTTKVTTVTVTVNKTVTNYLTSYDKWIITSNTSITSQVSITFTVTAPFPDPTYLVTLVEFMIGGSAGYVNINSQHIFVNVSLLSATKTVGSSQVKIPVIFVDEHDVLVKDASGDVKVTIPCQDCPLS